MKIIFGNGQVFNGDHFTQGVFVEVEGHRIQKVHDKKPAEKFIDLEGGYLVPAFIDAQIYGGNGKLFGEHPSVDALKATVEYSLAGGTTLILPTVATNAPEVMFTAIDAVREYWQQGLPGVGGLHLEGPYINVAKRGAHIAEFIHSPSLQEVKDLMNIGKGVVKMMTLAPEVCKQEVIHYLQDKGVIISAGHSNASFEEAAAAFAEGVQTVTHLFNAMSPLQHRAPGLAGAVMYADDVHASIIADGHHVDYSVIAVAKKAMGRRLFLITDAVTENKEGHYRHRLDGDKYVVSDGTLSGSALTMLQAVRNCIAYVELPLEECLRMASLYPASVLGLDHELGRIREGYAAELLWLDSELRLKAVYTNGEYLDL